MTTEHEYSPGLAGVPAARSSVCYLDGQVGKLQYRGYPIEVLAEHCSFEEIAHLLLVGHLPTRAELEAFAARLASLRSAPDAVLATLRSLPTSGHPMDALSVGLLTLGMHEKRAPRSAAERRDVATRLVAVLPTLVAASDRLRRGLEPVAPRTDLGHAANFVYMVDGAEPDPLVGRVLDAALVLHAEHQMNASTFSARVVGSTLADAYVTISAAVGALSGPLHGGANEEVLRMLEEMRVDAPADVRAWAADRLAKKEKISGFGHREYKVKDPRAGILQKLGVQLFEKLGSTPLYARATTLEAQMAELVGGKGVYPNVDFYSGIVYQKMGLATDLFTPVFAIARVAGWLAHWLEQLEDNRIFRPNQIWTGSADRDLVALDARG
jgi:citrate synthase